MDTALVYAASLSGCRADLVRVEARFEPHEKKRTDFQLTGLPDPVLRESRGRLLCALRENRLGLGSGQLNINLLPAAKPKVGEGLDLAVILAAAASRGHLRSQRFARTLFLGEVGIDGSLHAVRGGLAAAIAAQEAGLSELIAPSATAREAACLPGMTVFGADHLAQVLTHLTTHPSGSTPSSSTRQGNAPAAGLPLTPIPAPPDQEATAPDLRLDEVRGQGLAKFALALCAAGGHRLLLMGPPGTGKSMLAARLNSLLPAPNLRERLEITTVLAACQRWPGHIARERPFRAPHHTASFAGMVGGGPLLAPGEITLAHGGVLFLDELPEFRREVLECLRQPLESGTISISRAGRQSNLPAKVHLVAAMNPCPCGHGMRGQGRCQCSPFAVRRYRARVSGPLLDRFDVRLELGSPDLSELLEVDRAKDLQGPSAQELHKQIQRAGEIKQARRQPHWNVDLNPDELDRWAAVPASAQRLLQKAHRIQALSARSIQSLRRVARTLADMEGLTKVLPTHFAQAIALRRDWESEGAQRGPVQRGRIDQNAVPAHKEAPNSGGLTPNPSKRAKARSRQTPPNETGASGGHAT